MKKIQLIIKRGIDILISLLGLIILSPVLIIIMILIWKKMGRPIFFSQSRPGKNGRVFKMIKFRTMLNLVDKDGNLLPNEMRHTKFGRFLRSTSLDELPELINVLKGDMSLVGPRPLLVEYLSLYNNHQARRHEVSPGITGLAQVNGRNKLTWEQKFHYDIKYVDEFNLMLDMKILIMTIKKVFVKEGINFNEKSEDNKFTGGLKD